jgi:trigger factor
MGIEAEAEEPTVDDASVDAYLQYYILEPKATTEEVTDRAVQDGDVVNIDYAGYKDGVAFDGGTAQGFDLTIGSNTFIDGFEEGLIGANIGDTVSLNLTFPDPYPNNTDLAGQPVVFEVTINSISEEKVPELTDEFVQSLGIEDCSTEQELRDVIYNYFYESAVSQYTSTIEQTIQDTVMANCTFKEPPEEMVARMRQNIEDSMSAQAQSQSMTVTQYVSTYYGLDEDAYEDKLDEKALESAESYIMYQAIADVEGLEPTDDEIEEEVDERVETYGYESAEAYKESTDMEMLKEYVMKQKVLAFLKENGNITTTTAED